MARRSRRTEEDYLPEDPDEVDEEEDEEEPARRRRRRKGRDDDEDEKPRGRRRRAPRDEDDDEDDEDEDEDDRPARRRKSRGGGGKSSRRRGRSRDDDDEDDDIEPRRSSRRVSTAARGWGHSKKVREKSSQFAKTWKPGEDEELIKFLDDEPFASYGQHWFQEANGKKGWLCLQTLPEPEKCPGCEVGDKPKFRAGFSILVFDEDGEPQPEILEAGTWLSSQLEKLAEGRNGPLSEHYWAISSTGGGKKGPVKYDLQVVKERDLEEDWDIEPLSDDELDDFAEENEHTLDEIETIPSTKDFKALIKSLDD